MPALITWWTLDCRSLSPDLPADAMLAAGADLLGRWRTPVRRYHTTQHLVEMFWALEELEEAEAVDAWSAAVGRVAAWFHDAVYDPAAPAGVNESQSSDLARTTLSRLQFGVADIESIERLIDLTTDHAAVAPTPLETAFQDADLWILSADQPRFDEYCGQVREEYAQVPDAAYRAGRTAILTPLLERPAVYATTFGRRTWEAAARENLRRELARLA